MLLVVVTVWFGTTSHLRITPFMQIYWPVDILYTWENLIQNVQENVVHIVLKIYHSLNDHFADFILDTWVQKWVAFS